MSEKRKRILLVDDKVDVHRRVEDIFRGSEVRVEATTSWVDAKTILFTENPPDLLILDLKMPTIDGVALGKAIRRRLTLPIVVFSSEEGSVLSEAARSLGAVAAVSKSAPDGRLREAVWRGLKRVPPAKNSSPPAV